jgi:hypothetical protein
MGSWITLNTSIRELLSSNICLDSNYPDNVFRRFPQPLQASSWIECRLGHRWFFYNPSQFVFHSSTYLPMALQPFVGPWLFVFFLNFYTVDRSFLTGDHPIARSLPAYRTEQKKNKRTQTSMPQVGFKPTTPVFEQTKTVHTLDRAATLIGSSFTYYPKL